jgi:hypothetical protein
MAFTDPLAAMQGNINSYSIERGPDTGNLWRNFIPQPQPGKQPGLGGEPYDVSEEQKKHLLDLHMRVSISGYAFSSEVQSIQFAISILLVYASMAMAFMLHLLLSGHCSNAWELLPELFALGRGSEPPSGHLASTGGSIQAFQTLEEPVRISVKDGIIQVSQPADSVFEKVERNGLY